MIQWLIDYLYFTKQEARGTFVLVFLLCFILLFKWFNQFDVNSQELICENNPLKKDQAEISKSSFNNEPLNEAIKLNSKSSQKEYTKNKKNNKKTKVNTNSNSVESSKFNKNIEPGKTQFEDINKSHYVPLSVNINTADSLTMTELKGIGPVFARRIIKYRNRLGGFYSKDQLLEVYGMDSLRFLGFSKQIVIDTTFLVGVDINKDEFKRVLSHPYLNFQQVKVIFAYKDQHGEFQCISDLLKTDLVNEELLSKIAPYLMLPKC